MKSNPINVLFLDFDGVINNTTQTEQDVMYVVQNKLKHFDTYQPSLCANLNTLIQQFNFKVVISSSWRKTFDLITLRDIVNNQMNISCEVLDCTTRRQLDTNYKERIEYDPSATSRERGLQITDWLLEKKYTVKNYFILDDSLDAGYGHSNNYYRVDSKTGFDSNALTFVSEIINTSFK